MVRKISLTLVIIAGAFWVAGALAADYPKKTQAVDNLTNSFRPYFTDPALAQSAAARSSCATPTRPRGRRHRRLAGRRPMRTRLGLPPTQVVRASRR